MSTMSNFDMLFASYFLKQGDVSDFLAACGGDERGVCGEMRSGQSHIIFGGDRIEGSQ